MLKYTLILFLLSEKFYTPLIFTESDEINGYMLYKCNINIMDWFCFIELTKLYKNSKVYSREEFFDKCSNTCCTEWCKMDRNGEYYSGFWITDKENAWNLFQQDNFQGLYELPFPHDLIFRTVDIGCGNIMESVRYSNFLCYWVATSSNPSFSFYSRTKLWFNYCFLGFDAHQDDPLEGINISDEIYLFLTNKLKKLSKPLLFVTEGEYNVKTIRRLVPKID